MKITGPSRVSPQSPAKPARKASSDFKIPTPAVAAETETAAAHTSSPIASVEALIALQGDEGGGQANERHQAAERGRALLDILDGVRLEILAGRIPQRRLEALSHALDAKSAQFEDPRLRDVLDEIELRAKVELAKYERGI